MQRNIRRLLLVLTVVIAIGCKKENIVQPEKPEELKPGRRDYVWTVDTLPIPNNETFDLWRFWGAEANDLWFSGLNISLKYAVWHYDGTEWKSMNMDYKLGGSSVFGGFSKNDVWIASCGNMYHWDGNSIT